ncbi:MFS transporter [Legionella israelensis]|uniref:Lysosomal dipeptide transporter MFSD1 n=2 Tax=Legionella israelensis TaxID=454 RepID=A0AAX1EE09_9GAMM|nr:MFS transporter [Legionella israelensis]
MLNSGIFTKKKLMQAYLIWGIAALFVLYQVIFQTSVGVMMAPVRESFQLTYTQVGVLSSAFFYTYLFLQIPSGILVGRWGIRNTLLFALVTAIVSCIIFAKAQNISTAIFSRILMGAACAPAISIAMELGAQWFPVSMFAFIAGLTEALGMIGGAFGELGLSRLMGSIGLNWRQTMWVCVYMGLCLFFLAWIFVKNKQEDRNASEHDASPIQLRQQLMTSLTQPQIVLNGLFAAFTFAVVAAFACLWCVPFLQVAYQVDIVKSAHATSWYFIGAAIGTTLLGWIVDKTGYYRLCMGVSSLLSALLIFLLLQSTLLNFKQVTIVLFLAGLCGGCYVIPFVLIKNQVGLNIRAAALGYTNMMCTVLGAPILQPLIGWLLQSMHVAGISQVQAYERVLLIIPFCYLLAVYVVCFIKEPAVSRTPCQKNQQAYH